MTRTDYNKIADLYDKDKVRDKKVNVHLIEYLKEHNKVPHNTVKVLDVACGTGNQLIADKAAFPDIEMYGLDKFDKMLEQAGKKSQDITWIHEDMDKPGLSIGDFDFISCHFAHHHSGNKKQWLENVYHNLKRDGWFSIVNLDPFNMEDWYLYQFFPSAKTIDYMDFLRVDVLVEMAESAGFEVLSRKTHTYEEQIAVKDIYDNCSKRYSFSELMAISTNDYDKGLADIQARMQKNYDAMIKSRSVVLDVVFKKS